MIEQHSHGPDGEVILIAAPEPDVSPAEAIASADVQVAQINADRDIALAKIAAKTVEPDLEMQLAAALAEIEALRTQLAPPEPVVVDTPPAPVAVIQDVEAGPDPEPEMPMISDQPETSEPSQPSKKRLGLGMW